MPTLDDVPILDTLAIENLAAEDRVPVWDASTRSFKQIAASSLGNTESMSAKAPVLASITAGSYPSVLSNDTLSEVLAIEDYTAAKFFSFVSHPTGVTEFTSDYDYGSNLGAVRFYLAGLPNCTTMRFNNSVSWDSISVSDGENITTLDCSSSGLTTVAVPAGLTGLSVLDFSDSPSLATVTFTAGAHTSLGTVTIAGCTSLNTGSVDALLVSLEAANPSTMASAVYLGNGNGTAMSTYTHSGASFNILFTRTAANLAQLVVQPSLTITNLTTTDGPIGLTVTGNTSTGLITAKVIAVNTIAASVISFGAYPYQSKTLSAASYTFTSASAAAGKTVKLYFTQTYVGALAVTWFSGITWADGAPTYSNSTVTIVTLVATGASTYNGSFTTLGTLITNTTGTQLIAGINGNAEAATMVTASSGGTNTGYPTALTAVKLGNLAISKLVARGWTVTL